MSFLFAIISFYLFLQAFKLMSQGWKAMDEYNKPKRRHPEMEEVKEGDELLVVNFRELQDPRFKLDSPELHNLGDPLNKSLRDRIDELDQEEEDDGDGDVVVRR
jgi:hypothetical protein